FMQLSLDLYISILEHVPVQRYGDSVETLVTFSQTSTILREASQVTSLWEPFYRARYRFSEEIHEFRRKVDLDNNWRLMYAERRRKDKIALGLLDRIVDTRQGRYRHAATLTAMSFDVWDAMEIESSLPVPSLFDVNPQVGTRPCISPTRRFWASSILDTIAKRSAIMQWGNLVSEDGENVPSFVQAHSSLSCFFGKPLVEVESHLTSLTAECRAYLEEKRCLLDPDAPEYDLALVCTTICQFMLQQGFGPVPSLNFHQISNHFPHLYLTSHRRSIAISLVHAFVALARSVGVTASPINFPGRVLVHISSPPGADDFLVDVYGAETKAILSLRHDLPPMLVRMGVSPDALLFYVSPCGAAPMLLRAARNILSSITNDTSHATTQAAIFASICIHLLLTEEVQLITHMVRHVEVDPLDCATFLSDLQPFLRRAANREFLQETCRATLEIEEQEATTVHSRNATTAVAHYVGMVFQHRRYSYNACIIGWDPTCCKSEEWQMSMNVRSLTRGGNQPFYHVISLDGNHRYVAEDNISPIPFTEELAVQFLREIPVLPRYFSDICEIGWRLSPELVYAYPDDEFAS
ncbi:YccV-like-domain-containing protein, partial [Roridomyces roridus]